MHTNTQKKYLSNMCSNITQPCFQTLMHYVQTNGIGTETFQKANVRKCVKEWVMFNSTLAIFSYRWKINRDREK